VNKTDLLLHIGYQKTGTSWLQTHLFNNHAIGFCAPFTRPEIKKAIAFPSPLDFDSEQCRAYFDPGLRKARAEGSVPVISRERLSGAFFGGGYDSKELAERLAMVFPRAKVLLIIREQKSMLLSSYTQSIRTGCVYTLREYLSLNERQDPRLPLFGLKRFCYHRLIETYYSLFGKENVLVLPYEMFGAAPQSYVQTIATFAGIHSAEAKIADLSYTQRVNQAQSAVTIQIKRRLNQWMIRHIELNPTTILPITINNQRAKRWLPKIDRVIPKGIKDRVEQDCKTMIASHVAGYYQQSNSCTSNLINMDLAQYGYDLPSKKVE